MRFRLAAPRSVVVFHLLLALTLILLIVHNAGMAWRSARAADQSSTLAASALRLVHTGGGAVPDRVVVDFGTDMVAGDQLERAPAATLARIEPDTACTLRWCSPRQLELLPLESLPLARSFRVVLDPTLRARDGRGVPSELTLPFHTPSVRLTNAQVWDDDTDLRRGLTLHFDQPLAAKTLQAALSVRQDRPDGPLLPVQLSGEDDGRRWQVTLPAAEGAAAASRPTRELLFLRLDGTLVPKDGNVPMGEAVERALRLDEHLDLTGCEATAEGIELTFDRRVPLPEAGFLEVAPATPFQLRRIDGGLRIVGELKPGSSLAVTLKRGFPGVGRHRLAADARRVLHLPDRTPSLAFAQSGRVLSALALPELEITGVNVAACELTVQPVYANNLVRLAQERWPRMDHLAGAEQSLKLPITARRNESFHERVDLARLLGHAPRGLMHITLGDPEHRARSSTRLLQVTDLGLTVRATPDAIAVHVRSLARGTPVAQAQVRVLTPTNQVLAEQGSDGDGLAILRYRRTPPDREPFLVEARLGEDLSFVEFHADGVELADESLGGRSYAGDQVEAYVTAERGLFRPGEPLRAAVVVRAADGTAPTGMELEARWQSPDGRLRRSERVTVPATGLMALHFDTATAAATGVWRLTLRDPARDTTVGSERFLMETFVPDRLEAKAVAAATLTQGAQAEVLVRGNWLEGTPAAGQPVQLRVRLDHGTFAPADFAGFTFGTGTEDSPPGALPVITSALGADGTARLRCALPRSKTGAPLLARIEAEVLDPSGRGVHAGTQALALCADGQLGVRVRDTVAEVVLLDANGTPVDTDAAVEVQLLRRRWHTWYDDGQRGRFTLRCEARGEALEVQRMALAHGRGRVSLARAIEPPGYGWLVVRATCGERVSEQGLGAVPQRPDRLRVTPLTAVVLPGGEARIQIDAPAAGCALITLEGSTLHGARLLQLAAGRNECALPVPADLNVPNVHAVVTFTAPQARAEAVGPFHLVGGASLTVGHPERQTHLTLGTADTVLPESEVALTLHAPGAQSAHVALVDEGILQRTQHRSPDPLAWFLAPRQLDSMGADTGTALLGGVRFDPKVLTGGDGGDELAARMAGNDQLHIRTVALSTGPVALDAEGRATVRLRLPPYEGRLRVMAMAAGTRVLGAADAAIVVRGPLGLLLATPRVMAPGDRAELALTVRNSTGGDGTVAITVEPLGQRLEVPLADRAIKTVPLTWIAPDQVGPAELHVTARLGNHERTLHEQILVRPPAAYVSEAQGFVADGTAELRVPGTWVPGTLRARLWIDGQPDGQLLPILSSLLQYPYGCVEQTTSRAFAVLACQHLLPQLLPDGGDTTAAQFTQAAVDRLWSMQCYNGGLGYWPGAAEAYPYGSVHALDFLLQARVAGMQMPDENLQRLVQYVTGILDHGQQDLGLLCAAAEVLTRAGRPVEDWLVRLAAVVTAREDRCRLALGFAQLGQLEAGRRLLATPGPEPAARERVGMLRSPVRCQALELRARLACTPGDPGLSPLADQLCTKVRRARDLTTQEQSHALLALAAHWRAHAPAHGPARATVVVRGQRREVQGGKAVALELAVGDVVQVESQSGRVYGCLELAGFSTDAADAAPPGLRITHRLLHPETGAMVTELERGHVYVAEIEVQSKEPMANVLVTDLLPGGLELEGRDHSDVPRRREVDQLAPDRVERRDDRLLAFRAAPFQGRVRFLHRVRAVFPGTYALPAASVEELYTPGLRTTSGATGTITVRP